MNRAELEGGAWFILLVVLLIFFWLNPSAHPDLNHLCQGYRDLAAHGSEAARLKMVEKGCNP
jgi:hypothetical protein